MAIRLKLNGVLVTVPVLPGVAVPAAVATPNLTTETGDNLTTETGALLTVD